jgi:hypothetical protein
MGSVGSVGTMGAVSTVSGVGTLGTLGTLGSLGAANMQPVGMGPTGIAEMNMAGGTASAPLSSATTASFPAMTGNTVPLQNVNPATGNADASAMVGASGNIGMTAVGTGAVVGSSVGAGAGVGPMNVPMMTGDPNTVMGTSTLGTTLGAGVAAGMSGGVVGGIESTSYASAAGTLPVGASAGTAVRAPSPSQPQQ